MVPGEVTVEWLLINRIFLGSLCVNHCSSIVVSLRCFVLYTYEVCVCVTRLVCVDMQEIVNGQIALISEVASIDSLLSRMAFVHCTVNH